MIFGYRGNTQLHAKKDRLSKDCFIAEFFGTQLYMQILVMDTGVSGHKQCVYTQFTRHLLNIETVRCILTSLGQPQRWAGIWRGKDEARTEYPPIFTENTISWFPRF